ELDDQTGKVKVTIAVDRKYTVWNTDVAEISQDLLSRDTTIDLITERSTTPPAAPRPAPAGAKDEVRPVGATDVPGTLFAAGQPPPAPPPGQLPAPPGEPLPPG